MTIESELKLRRIERWLRERRKYLAESVDTGEWMDRGDFRYRRGKIDIIDQLILEYFLTADEYAELDQTGREMGLR